MVSFIDINSENAFLEKSQADNGDVRNRSLAIFLPHQVSNINRIAVDIGGSLAKCVNFEQGAIRFKSIETSKIDELLDSMKPLVTDKSTELRSTGGGAFKYHDKMLEELEIHSERGDEIECLIIGATFLMTSVPNEVFYWVNNTEDHMKPVGKIAESYPYMLVNIGSGVGFIKVTGPDQFERVGGSAVGGGTLWGLLAMLTNAQSFDEMLQLSSEGDNTKVDMLVGDIYGGGYSKMGLSASTTASFFAKAFNPEHQKEFNDKDISRSLLLAISYNIAQLAYLHARFYGIEHIYFAGSYIRGHPQTIETLSTGIEYWSKGEKTAFFFRHEGYLGALGAFLKK